VVMLRPAARLTGSMHDREAVLSTSTVQAPHCPRPQPNFGPCSARDPRSA
jgi:hypothetical protein